ncbi:MAG: ion channel, partial [Bacteroidales bacterium]|nr:ion channel [Bacteroidales bacterium]
YLLKKYKSILIYFQSEKKLADYYAEKHQIELDSYNEFKTYLQTSSGNIPAYLVWLGKPLYRFSATRRMLSSYIYNKFEILGGEWNSLKPKKKKLVSFITIMAIFLFIVYALISKAINSFFLSINTFSTLGFGSIPVKGISRYMAILQGFLGWFLLSIFSVSLINQILQN